MSQADDLSQRDLLFSNDGNDWWNNACLDWTSDKWPLYASGYRRAGDILIDRVHETASDQDLLVYPAMFLYRQYLELELKGIARAARKVLDEPGGVPSGHKIQGLWDTCHPLVLRAFPGESRCELDELGRLIREFAAVDPLAQSFRYPVDSNGLETLPGVRLINLRNTQEVIAKMAVLLEGISSMLDLHLEYKLEMESEFRE